MALPHFEPVHTARLTIRPVRADDLPDLLAVNGDDAVTQFLPCASWASLDDGTAWLARMQALAATGTGTQLVIEQQADGRVLGGVLLFNFNEGRARQRWVAKGQTYDTQLYGCLASEWGGTAG